MLRTTLFASTILALGALPSLAQDTTQNNVEANDPPPVTHAEPVIEAPDQEIEITPSAEVETEAEGEVETEDDITEEEAAEILPNEVPTTPEFEAEADDLGVDADLPDELDTDPPEPEYDGQGS